MHEPDRSIPVTVAAAVEAIEGLGLVGAGGYVAWGTIVGQPRDLSSAIALAVITVLTGVALLLVARGLWQARRWSRAPAVITQMFVLIVAVPMVRGDESALGIPMVVLAVLGLVVLLMPETAHVLSEEAATTRSGTVEPPSVDDGGDGGDESGAEAREDGADRSAEGAADGDPTSPGRRPPRD